MKMGGWAHVGNQEDIRLKKLPRTPQHNTSAEIAVREIKEEAMLEHNIAVQDIESRHDELVVAILKINNRIISSKKLKSANKLVDKMNEATTLIDCDLFYTECLNGIKSACA